MKPQSIERTAIALAATAGLGLVFTAQLAEARGKTPPSPPANPDMVYMSLGSTGTATEIRGATFSLDGRSVTDVSLFQASRNRDHTSVTWSPDGTRFAWIEGGTIRTASPGQKATVIYNPTNGINLPTVVAQPDSLAWGRGCDSTSSQLVFAGDKPWGVYSITITNGIPGSPVELVDFTNNGAGWAFAFSPTGRHLAIVASGVLSYGIWLVPMCTADHTPYRVVAGADLGGSIGSFSPASMDWSRHGDRLALSVVTGPDRNYPWVDLKIVRLNYSNTGGELVYSNAGVWTVNLDGLFTAASSEHSPQWGPSEPGANCQRIAFSQSSDSGRNLYLLDIGSGPLDDSCDIKASAPLAISARNPRALDWK